MKLRGFNKNESDYEVLRDEALKKYKESHNVSLILKDGMAVWAMTLSSQQSVIPQPLSDMRVLINVKQPELIHALANIIIHH